MIPGVVAGRPIAVAPPSTERTPMQWEFDAFFDRMMIDVQPLRAEVQDFDETFASTANLDVTGTPFGGGMGSVSASGNVLTVASGQNTAVMEKTSVSSFPVPDCFIECDIAQQGSSGTLDIVEVGFFLDQNNFVTASLDRAGNKAWVQVTNHPSTNRVAEITYSVPTGPIRLGLAYQLNWAAVYVDSGSGWEYVTGGDTGVYLSLLETTSFNNLRAGIILASASPTTWQFNRLRSGRFGAEGFRDPTLMTNRDGTPYVEGGKFYLSATTNLVAGTAGSSVLTMFEIDTATMDAEIVGRFYVTRAGHFSQDINLHIVDNGDGTQDLFWATWGQRAFYGDGNLRIAHKAVTGDWHKGTHVATSFTTLAVPMPSGLKPGAYDPMAWHDGTNWNVVYSEMPDSSSFTVGGYWPALASSPDLSTWIDLGNDSAGAFRFEGTKVAKVGGAAWYFAGGPEGFGDEGRIYDAALAYQGDLDATFSGGPNTQPHPMAFVHGDYAWLITYDNTRIRTVNFSWGKYIVQRSPRYV